MKAQELNLESEIFKDFREKMNIGIKAMMANLIGKKLPVIVEGFMPEDDCYIGRTYRDAPEVDGYIFFKSSEERLTGDIVSVTISGANGYDLTGEMAE